MDLAGVEGRLHSGIARREALHANARCCVGGERRGEQDAAHHGERDRSSVPERG
jgi:hypothetical protein